jgi:S-formylglutathione hydrolase FrmB
VFSPDSGALVVVLVAVFAGLICAVIRARHLAVRLAAAVLAFVPAGLSGVAAVNMYYGYYGTWSAIAADVSGGTGSYPALHSLRVGSAARPGAVLGRTVSLHAAAARGLTVRLQVPGARSRISRSALIYLPAQYFQPVYAAYRFPVIELMHGFPGQPQDWITVLQVTAALADLTAGGRADPAVLVMPQVSGPRRWSEQCLNQAGGPQDATYLARDLPAYVAARLRVLPPGPGWGIAGYSAGGFCAANLALGYPHSYGAAGVMSGYFTPEASIIAGRLVDPFGGSARLRQCNTPLRVASRWDPRMPMPRFWLSAGNDSQDYQALLAFRQVARRHLPAVPVYLSAGGHTAAAWQAALSPMLQWMTPLLATAPRPRPADGPRTGPARNSPGLRLQPAAAAEARKAERVVTQNGSGAATRNGNRAIRQIAVFRWKLPG